MGSSRRKFTQEFKLSAVRRLQTGVPLDELARAIEVHPSILHRWRKEHLKDGGNAFPGAGKARGPEGRIAELERKVGQQILEIDFLRGRLQSMEEQQRPQTLRRKPVSTSGSKSKGKKTKTA